MTTTETGVGSVRFRDLGDLLVEVGGATRAPGGSRLDAALATLLAHANRRVPVDVLSSAMWPEGPPRTSSTLTSHLWRLRQVLEPGRRAGAPSSLLVSEQSGYRLVVTSDQVDSARFPDLVDEAATLNARGFPEQAQRRCEQARELWRGRPFTPVATQPWAAPVVARLEEYRAQLDERHVEALLATGRPDRALLELERALGEHPLREHLWAQRMVAAYRAGRVDDALAAYERARALLREELGADPSDELREVHRRVLVRDPGLGLTVRPAAMPAAAGVQCPDLPRRAGRLVGRDRELAGIAELLRRRPLVTVTGPAGVGKTRLTAEIADEVADEFPDGVWFVDLVGAQDDDQIVDAVTTGLGLAAPPRGSQREAVRAFVRDRRMLLVLDDCEHVVGEVAALAEFLGRAGPELVVLATSREPLALDGEEVVELAPLPLPAAGRTDASGPALELFLERVAALHGGLPDAIEADAVRVCRAVDGIPLAIELAAARTRTFTVAEVADQAERDPGTLSQLGRRRHGPQATVHAAVERSHRLLDAAEQRVHRDLAVLPGPFTVRAAAAVAGIDDGTAADLLADLAHRSLLVPHGPARAGRASRFAQLNIVRGHAGRVLADAGEGGAARRRRDGWLVAMATEDRPRLGTAVEQRWSEALDDDLSALRGTLQQTLVEEPSPVGVEIAAGLGGMFWYQRDAMLEGGRWTEVAHRLAAGDPQSVSPFTRALLHLTLSGLRAFAGRGDLAAPLCDRGLDELGLVTPSPDQELLVGDALVVLCLCLWLSGEHDRARRVLARIDTSLDRTPDPTLHLLRRVPAAMTDLGERPPGTVLDTAAAVHRDAVAADNRLATWVAAGVAQLAAVAAGESESALHWSDVCLEAIDRTGRRQVPLWLEMRANILAMLGRHEEALRLYGAARTQNRFAGAPWPSLTGTTGLLDRAQASVSRAGIERIRRGTPRLGVRELLMMIGPGQSQT